MASTFNGRPLSRVDAPMAFPFRRGARRARLPPTGSSWGDTLFRAGSGAAGVAVLVPLLAGYVAPALQGSLGFLPVFQGTIYGTNLFTAGVILAIMIIPTVSAVTRDALTAVPQNQREAALSLGATRWESIRIGVL